MSRDTYRQNLKTKSKVLQAIDQSVTVERFVHKVRDRTGLVAFESLYGHKSYGRYSLVSFEPLLLLRCRGLEDSNPFEQLEDIIARYEVSPSIEGLPFVGGWMGYLGYEAGRFLERLPGRAVRDLALPLVWFGLYDTVAIFDHILKRWHIAGVEFPQEVYRDRPSLENRLAEYEKLLTGASEEALSDEASPGGRTLDLGFDRPEYFRKVRRILDYIRAGDIYQANLTQRFAVDLSSRSWDLYRSLRKTNPADYAAYLSCGEFEVLCSSPELFLQVQDRRVLTRPIKGTRPRSSDPVLDASFQAQLCSSEKDLAELTMIVDLERNDLGRVCEAITVAWPPVIETHPTVHHLVADVRGILPEDRNVIDLLRAAFPGGSVTGAPKIRAMEIIDQLEPVARGPYCGAIGYIGLDGSMTLNMAIRTMICKAGTAYVHAGGGIVADSDPDAEYQEILAKSKGLFKALRVMTQFQSAVVEHI